MMCIRNAPKLLDSCVVFGFVEEFGESFIFISVVGRRLHIDSRIFTSVQRCAFAVDKLIHVTGRVKSLPCCASGKSISSEREPFTCTLLWLLHVSQRLDLLFNAFCRLSIDNGVRRTRAGNANQIKVHENSFVHVVIYINVFEDFKYIVVKKGNMRYGRLLEIKNPVSREITGIPKKEYWVQMQVQMHVLGLHLCDFLETSFKEYDDEAAFKNDGTFSSSECGNRKGIMACFHDGSSPVYKEAPTNCTSFEGPEGFDAWLSSTIEANGNLTWIRNSYWKLGKMSCVLVRYNPEWMCYALKEFENVWNAVLYDREHGYEHRKPKKREKRKKCTPSQPTSIQQLGMTQESFKNAVIKIRTESFDESSI